MSIFWIILLLLLGFTALIKGADVFVDGSAGMARRMRVSDFFIGVTLVALGTSLPEFMVSLLAGFSDNGQLAMGNVIGSNIANIALILGFCGLFIPVKMQPDSLIKRDIPFIILSGVVLFILGFDRVFQNHNGTVDRLTMGDGLILLSFFLVFLFYSFGSFKSSRSLEVEIEEKGQVFAHESVLQLSIKIIGGLLAVIGGGKLVVDNSVALADIFGVSQGLIGLTIVAIGTSLPEAVTTIMAVLKKKEEIAIGNIIGSNTLNIFLVLGFAVTTSPFDLSPAIMTDVVIMIAVSIALFGVGYFRKAIGKLSGASFLAGYLLYMVFIILRK